MLNPGHDQGTSETHPDLLRSILVHLPILDAVGEAVMITDLAGTLVHWNKSAEKLYGWRREEVLGRNVVDVTPLEMNKEQAHQIMEHLRRGETWEGDFMVRDKEGRRFLARVKDAPIFDDEGELIGMVGVSRDRTKELEAMERETEAARQKVELEHLKKRDSERARFVQMVAHEVNNPVTPIRTQLHVLKRELEGLGSPQVSRSIQIIERNVIRTTRLLKDLLDVARIHSGRLRLQIQQVDLQEVVDHCVNDLMDEAKKNGVDVSASVEEGLSLQADPDRMSQIILNLLSNSIKFTSPDGRVTIEAHRRNGHVRVSIQDTGRGVAEEDIPRIFDPFEQFGEEQEGSGLGLFITKKIAQEHGGRIWCESPGPGRGTTFTFELPVTAETGPRS